MFILIIEKILNEIIKLQKKKKRKKEKNYVQKETFFSL